MEVGRAPADDEARSGGAMVTARPGNLTPLAVTRKSITQIPANSIRKVKKARKKRLKSPLVHKTINVSIIFPWPFLQIELIISKVFLYVHTDKNVGLTRPLFARVIRLTGSAHARQAWSCMLKLRTLSGRRRAP